jgi:hypothetical protein
MIESKQFRIALMALVLMTVFCGQAVPEQKTTPSQQTNPTPTPVPKPPPPASIPAELPEQTDLQMLVLYINAMNPMIDQASAILERDGEILQAAEQGDDEVLCDGRLKEDNEAIKLILVNIDDLTPPPDAAVIHNLVLESGEAWIEAMDNVELFCDTGNALHKIPAALKFWEAATKLQDAGNRFWLLILAKGVEDWVQR